MIRFPTTVAGGILLCSGIAFSSKPAWSLPPATGTSAGLSRSGAVPVSVPDVAVSDSESNLAKARVPFGLGVELLQGDPIDYQRAYGFFLEAYRLSNSWKVLGNLGLCAYHLERYGDALQYYSGYLAQGSQQASTEEIASVRSESQIMLADSGIVSLVGDNVALTVVDTRLGASIDPQAYPLPDNGFLELRLKVGEHRLVATNSQGASAVLQFKIAAGQSFAGKFDFSEEEPEPLKGDQASTSVLDNFSDTQIAGMGVTAVGASVAVAAMSLAFIATGKERSGRARCEFGQSSTHCEKAAKADFAEQDKYFKRANILWAVGGVAAVTGLGLVVFGGAGEQPGQTHLEVVPFGEATGGGLIARGRF